MFSGYQMIIIFLGLAIALMSIGIWIKSRQATIPYERRRFIRLQALPLILLGVVLGSYWLGLAKDEPILALGGCLFSVLSVAAGVRIILGPPPSDEELRRSYLEDPIHCPKCGYRLTGNTSGTCPECAWQLPRSPQNSAGD